MHRHEQAGTAIRSLVGLLICLLAACSSQKPPDDGTGDSVGRPLAAGDACSVDPECQVGLRCDPERRICVCTSDASCPDYLECDPFSGRCVVEAEGCSDDTDCAEGLW